jgi:hypothetical protein
MIDHRRLQRTLFRAQMDPSFAARVLAGDEPELALLRAASRAGITADPSGTRRLQVLGNATLEFRLCLAASDDPRARLEAFSSSEEFHAAIEQDRPLPLAAGAYLQRVLATQAWPHALAQLEAALAAVRRADPGPQPPAGCWQRAHRARVIELPTGTLAFAGAVHAALQAGQPCPAAPAPPAPDARESILVHAPPAAHRWKLTDAIPEEVNEAVAALFLRATDPLDEASLEAFAQEYGATAADLLPLMQDYAQDGALVRGA